MWEEKSLLGDAWSEEATREGKLYAAANTSRCMGKNTNHGHYTAALTGARVTLAFLSRTK